MRSLEGYRQRLSELVLRGMDSDVLSCRISSTAVCVEVRLGRGVLGELGRGCWVHPPHSTPQDPALRGI